jgi:maltooligosyltrehalose synthase
MFTFRDAAKIIAYLHELGISDIYASPYFRAKAGSLHGYDIIDHNALNPEIGTEEDYATMTAELKRHGMGQVLDIVPNHMCVDSPENMWWADVLENGPSSPYARHFDIDWAPVKKELKDKVLIPVLRTRRSGWPLRRALSFSVTIITGSRCGRRPMFPFWLIVFRNCRPRCLRAIPASRNC